MTTDLLIAQIKGIEAQLATLRAQLERDRKPAPPKTLGELRGILAGQGDFSEEEIDEVLYRFDWEDDDSPGTAE